MKIRWFFGKYIIHDLHLDGNLAKSLSLKTSIWSVNRESSRKSDWQGGVTLPVRFTRWFPIDWSTYGYQGPFKCRTTIYDIYSMDYGISLFNKGQVRHSGLHNGGMNAMLHDLYLIWPLSTKIITQFPEASGNCVIIFVDNGHIKYRSWNNGMRCMSYYVLKYRMITSNEKSGNALVPSGKELTPEPLLTLCRHMASISRTRWKQTLSKSRFFCVLFLEIDLFVFVCCVIAIFGRGRDYSRLWVLMYFMPRR